jgi:hypothetical protein
MIIEGMEGYFDDSGSSSREPVFVLAGFIATTEQWASFSKKWAAKIDGAGLVRFKMAEAMGLYGEFKKGWSPSTRDKFVLELAEIVADHVFHRFDVSLRRKDFDDLLRRAALIPELDDPYYLLFQSTCRSVFERQHRLGLTQPCDFIFDEQGSVGLRAVTWWPGIKDWFHPKVHHLIGSPPIFRNDVRFRPLQAADMYAWLQRERQVTNGDGRWQARAYLRALLNVPHTRIRYTRDHLLGFRADLTLNNIRFGVRPRGGHDGED